MKLIFERSVAGRGTTLVPPCGVPEYTPQFATRTTPLHLPEVSENDISRHYTCLTKETHGVNDGFYPLGSCTMKYNPKVNDAIASMPGFAEIHPLQSAASAQGCLAVVQEAEHTFCEITGMDAMTFQPAAGAHGEFTGLLLIKKYHETRGDLARNKIIVPDSAHGTNPASAVMVGYQIINIPSMENGCVDLDALRAAVGDDTAGLMLTNPNTVGIFDENILEITKIVHEAGGLNYYDGANLNAIMGIVRPGDMGFDVIHLNLHKTFSTPHGGGGPGSGPVGCKALLAPFLPGQSVITQDGARAWAKAPQSVGQVKAFHGNFLVTLKALSYALMLGKEGIPEASRNAVLNANYIRTKLSGVYKMAYDKTCMHEFVMSLEPEKESLHVSAMDVAKALLDYKMHPPTMYFPLIVHEALMIEPTETESKETLDEMIAAFLEIHQTATENPDYIRSAPHTASVTRLDEVQAARNPKLTYQFTD